MGTGYKTIKLLIEGNKESKLAQYANKKGYIIAVQVHASLKDVSIFY